jgi:hypothetical protein
MLEKYFKQQFAESFKYRAIGTWWELKGNQNEIDIVALKLEKNQALVAEVKRQKKNFKPELFASKVEHLKNKLLPNYHIEMVCLSLRICETATANSHISPSGFNSSRYIFTSLSISLYL